MRDDQFWADARRGAATEYGRRYWRVYARAAVARRIAPMVVSAVVVVGLVALGRRGVDEVGARGGMPAVVVVAALAAVIVLVVVWRVLVARRGYRRPSRRTRRHLR